MFLFHVNWTVVLLRLTRTALREADRPPGEETAPMLGDIAHFPLFFRFEARQFENYIYNRLKPWYHIKLLEIFRTNDMRTRSVPL